VSKYNTHISEKNTMKRNIRGGERDKINKRNVDKLVEETTFHMCTSKKKR